MFCLLALSTMSSLWLPLASPSSIDQSAIKPEIQTDAVLGDADDPAIWICREDPSRSLILGTDKSEGADGALYVFGLDGKTRQRIGGLDRPNNVDVQAGLKLGGLRVDIAVLTERNHHRLRAFAIPSDGGELVEVSSAGRLDVFQGEPGLRGAPMGIAIYRRPTDGEVFAVLSRKEGPTEGYLWQYRLHDDGKGRVAATKVREFGTFSGEGEIEAVAVDDAAGRVYYADEGHGIHVWHADPDHPDAGDEITLFGRTEFKADREGIAVMPHTNGQGFLLFSDQVEGGSPLLIFDRAGDLSKPIATIQTVTDDTDGLEATSTPLGPRFPRGLVVMMNSRGHNFFLYSWDKLNPRR
jgi:3-phytase